MAQRLPIPSSPEDITAPWLTEALRSTGTIDPSTRVTRLTKRALDTEGAGQSSWGSHLSVEYADASSDPPRQLFVKGMLPDQEMYADLALDMFRHELIFYQRISPATRIRVPKFYYGDLSADPAAAVIIMESLASDSIATMDSNVSMSDAKLVLDELAHLHGRWWNSAEIDEIPWTADFMKGGADLFVPRVPVIWKRMKAETPELLNDGTRAIGDLLVERVGDVWDYLLAAPRTIAQLDSRFDNVAFRERSSGRCAVVFDWGTCAPGPAVLDLGLLLFPTLEGGALDWLPALIEHYCSRLAEEGVMDYPVDRAMEDLAVGALGTLMIRIYGLGAALDLGRSHPRTPGRRLAFERVARAVEYMNGLEVLRAL